jgi:hypothetical protein
MMGWDDVLKNKKDEAKGAAKENLAKRPTTSRWNVKARATRP